MLRSGLVLCCVLWGLGPAGARADGDAAPEVFPEQAADAVLSALGAKDEARIARLAAAPKPDPWSVADELVGRGRLDAAIVMARRAPDSEDARKRIAYLTSPIAAASDAEARKAFAKANAALDAGDTRGVLSALEGATPSPGSLFAARVLATRAGALQVLRRFPEAQKEYTAAADIVDPIGWLALLDRVLVLGGQCAYLGSDWNGAVSLWERRLAVTRQREEPDQEAQTLANLGAAHRRLGELPKALDALQRAVSLESSLGGRDPRGLANALHNLGLVEDDLGDGPAAIDAHRRALAIEKELGVPEQVADAHWALGVSYESAHLPWSALPEFEACLAAKQGAGADDRQVVETLGSVYEEVGDLTTGIQYLNRALASAREARDRAAEARIVHNLAVASMRRGDFAQASEGLDHALGILQSLGDRASAATTLATIGTLHNTIGDSLRALEYHRRALAERQESGDRAAIAASLEDLALDEQKLGRAEEARAHLEKALATWREEGNALREAHALTNLALADAGEGSYQKAAESAGAALAIMERAGDRRGQVAAQANLAEFEARTGRLAEARGHADRARALAGEAADRDVLVRVLSLDADLLLAEGKPKEALETARDAVQEMDVLSRGLADEQGASSRGEFADVFELGRRAALRQGDVASAAFFLESGRSGALLEALGGRARLQETALPEALRRAEGEARGREALAAARVRRAEVGGDLAEVRARQAELASARSEVRDVIERIQREAKSAADVLYPSPAPLEAIESSLRPGEVLLLYGTDGPEAVALVVGKETTRAVSLGRGADISKAAEALLAPGGVDVEGNVAALRSLVVAPLALDASVQRVLVSPDAGVALVPFSLLIPDREVAYVPSGTTYGVLSAEPDPPGAGVLALGDPDPAALPTRAADKVYDRGRTLGRLPGTRDEAKAVGDVVLLGQDASESAFRTAVASRPRWRSVHFACHGLVDPARPALSSLVLTPSGDDDGFLGTLEVFRMRIPANLVVLSACDTGKGKVVQGEGIVGLTRAFLFAGAPRVICSLWEVDDLATRALMVKFYDLWNPRDGSKPMGTAAALTAAQAYVRTYEKEVEDVEATKREGHQVTKKIRPWENPSYWAAWVLWGLPE